MSTSNLRNLNLRTDWARGHGLFPHTLQSTLCEDAGFRCMPGHHAGACPKTQKGANSKSVPLPGTAKPSWETQNKKPRPLCGAFSSVSLPKVKISGFRKKRFCALTQNIMSDYLSLAPHCYWRHAPTDRDNRAFTRRKTIKIIRWRPPRRLLAM